MVWTPSCLEWCCQSCFSGVDHFQRRSECPWAYWSHVGNRPETIKRESYLNDEILVSEFDSPALLFPCISNLVVLLPFLCIEPQVLSQIEKEASVIASKIEAGRPTMRSVATDNIAWVFPLVSSRIVVPVIIAFNPHEDNVGLPDYVLFVFKCFEHGLDGVLISVAVYCCK